MSARKRSKKPRPAAAFHTIQGPLGQRLRLSQRTRDQNLKDLKAIDEPILVACNEVMTWFQWMAALCTDEAITSLVERVHLDACRGLEASLAGDYPTVNDVGRDLMEIEALLRDFLRDPSQVQKWAQSADDHAAAGAFSFGRIIDRLRASEGLDQDYVLPDKHEYMAHSESLHPTPRGQGPGAWGIQDRRVQLDRDLGEVLTHLGRTLDATIQLADATDLFERAEGEPPPLDALERVKIMLTVQEGRLLSVLNEAGVKIRSRGPYKRKEGISTSRSDPG